MILLIVLIGGLRYTTYCQSEIIGTLPRGYVAIREADAKKYVDSMKVLKLNSVNCSSELELIKLRVKLLVEDSVKSSDSLAIMLVHYSKWKDKDLVARLEKQLKQKNKIILQKDEVIAKQKITIYTCVNKLDYQNLKKFMKKAGKVSFGP